MEEEKLEEQRRLQEERERAREGIKFLYFLSIVSIRQSGRSESDNSHTSSRIEHCS